MTTSQRNKAFNRIGDAYQQGVAPWLYDGSGSVAVRVWCIAETVDGVEEADRALNRLLDSVRPLLRKEVVK